MFRSLFFGLAGALTLAITACSANGLSNPTVSSVQPPLAESQSGTTISTHANAGYRTLYSFKGGADGAYPFAGLNAKNGALYGTTSFGGASGWGTVFELNPSGSERVLHSFNKDGVDGAMPYAAMVALNGEFYGTTYAGGSGNCSDPGGCGTIFTIRPDGKERVLHSSIGGADGAFPYGAGLTILQGAFYGTTSGFGDGASDSGTVFELDPHTGAERVLHNFQGGSGGANPPDGAEPLAGLVVTNGALYGTTSGGDARNTGTVFEIIGTSGKERVVYSFGENGAPDGFSPVAGLIAMNGELYGTTLGGGSYIDYGTVFAVSTSGKERVLHSFKGGTDGAYPRAGLVARNGSLYGTTKQGGGSGCYGSEGCGTVFEISAAGKERILYRFKGGADGANPQAGLFAMSGRLYGTTEFGGATNSGTVFVVTP